MKIKYFLAVALLVFAFLIWWFIRGALLSRRMTPKQWESALSHIAYKGAPRSAVEKFFKQKNVEILTYVDAKDLPPVMDPDVKASKIPPQQMSGTLFVREPSPRNDYPTTWYVEISVFLDKKQRVLGYQVEEHGDGF